MNVRSGQGWEGFGEFCTFSVLSLVHMYVLYSKAGAGSEIFDLN